MLKKLKILFFALVVFFPGCRWFTSFVGNENSRGMEMAVNGFIKLKDRELDSLVVHGSAELRDVVANTISISGNLEASNLKSSKISVSGMLNAGNLKAKKLDVAGSANLFDGSHIEEETVIAGSLNATDSFFKKVEAASERIVLSNCEVQELAVKEIRPEKKQIVELIGGTIYGDVIFERDGGQVFLKSGAQVKGKVVRASVIR